MSREASASAAVLATIAEVVDAARTVHARLSLRDDIKRILENNGTE